MTRFDILHRFASDGKTDSRHIAIFHVLSEMWLTMNRPESFEPDVPEVARLLRVGYSTAMRWLNELEKFGYIELRRGRNQHEKSTLLFRLGHASTETAQREMRDQTGFGYASTETPLPEMREHNVKRESVVMREMRQHDVKRKSTASIERADFELQTTKTLIPADQGSISENAASAQPFLVHNNNHLINDLIINSKGGNEVDHDGKRVQGKNQTAPKSNRGHAAKTSGCAFVDSPLADIVKFREAFSSDSTANAADLDHYHARLLNWRDKKGNVPERTDWLATAKTFLLNDYREGKLVTVTKIKPLTSNAKPRNDSRGAVIEPQSTTNRRFGNW